MSFLQQKSTMSADPSVADDAYYVRIIEPWFLNTVNKMSNSNTSVRVSKIEAFDKARLKAFKSDKAEYEKYVGKKGSEIYWNLVEMVVQSLLKRDFLIFGKNQANVMITQKGIDMCNMEGQNGWHKKIYPIEP